MEEQRQEPAQLAEQFGRLAQVWSTYESRHASSDDKPFVRGINSFQLVKIGDDWKVLYFTTRKRWAVRSSPSKWLIKSTVWPS